MSVGENLKALRKENGLTQSNLAKRLGHSTVGSISKWETNRESIPIDKFGELAEIFNLEERELTERLSTQEKDSNPLVIWHQSVAVSDIDEGVRFILLCLPVFEEEGVVAVTPQKFAETIHVGVERIIEDWPKMLETRFVKQIGSPELGVLKLMY